MPVRGRNPGAVRSRGFGGYSAMGTALVAGFGPKRKVSEEQELQITVYRGNKSDRR